MARSFILHDRYANRREFDNSPTDTQARTHAPPKRDRPSPNAQTCSLMVSAGPMAGCMWTGTGPPRSHTSLSVVAPPKQKASAAW